MIIKKGRTNWKYILLVFILAAVVGGGLLGYMWWLEKQDVIEPESQILENTKKQNEERFYCQTVEDCTKYRTCSEECVNRDYEKNNPYNGPQCGAPWEFGCRCINNKCEIGDPSF